MNPVVHFELPYKVAVRAVGFYEQVFGWKTQQLGPEMNDYILVATTETDAIPGKPAGAIDGGMFPVKPDWPDQFPSLVIGIDNVQETIEKIKEHGGEVLGEPMDIPGTGLYVSFRDSEGNRNSILQPKM